LVLLILSRSIVILNKTKSLYVSSEESWLMRKGDLAWDTIGKLVIGLAFMVVLALIIFFARDKMGELLKELVKALRFGL